MPLVAAPGTSAGSPGWVRPPRPARCRWRIAADVSVHHDPEKGAHWGGIERCSSVWACPVCSAVIRAERAREVMAAVEAWQAQGGSLAFVTLTVRHKHGDDLRTTLDAVLRGFQRLQSGAPWVRFKQRFGVRGVIRSVEVTLGANGWHPHIHALFFLDRPLSAGDVDEWESSMFGRWAGIVTRLGARLPTQPRGIDVRPADADGRVVGQYLAKLQEASEKRYRVGDELVRFDFKSGRSGSLMPFELLDSGRRADEDDDRAAYRLWVEYFQATFGRRAITWSHGLRDLCAVEEERTDEEVMADVEASPLVFLVPGSSYDRIRSSPDVLALVLARVEAGDVRAALLLSGGFIPPDVVDRLTGEICPFPGLPPPALPDTG